MITITQDPLNEIVIPVQGSDILNFTFVHHMSGKRVLLSRSNIQSPSSFFSALIDSSFFKYDGLYSFVVNDGVNDIYSSLAKVVGVPVEVPTYKKDNSKDYELYK